MARLACIIRARLIRLNYTAAYTITCRSELATVTLRLCQRRNVPFSWAHCWLLSLLAQSSLSAEAARSLLLRPRLLTTGISFRYWV
jgi:hypothetical protein